jgi:tripartite-type tricarboxylate transporter receptor subunit TctC
MIRPFLEENMTITRRSALLGAAALPFAQAAMAQAFPTRPLRIIVAYPAGGPTDAIARIVAQDIAGPLGQNVVVENVAGASGAIGTSRRHTCTRASGTIRRRSGSAAMPSRPGSRWLRA